MIPKVIHFCWFGHNPKPRSVEKCIASWKRYCPEFQIIEWTEDNFDVGSNLYCKQAYDAKKWAFASDYARLKIIHDYGGIYLDTDVELIKSWDPLLSHSCFIGRQRGFQVNTGAGFGAEKGHPAIKRMLDDYDSTPFILANGEMDLLTCPHRNSRFLFNEGLEKRDIYQEIFGIAVYPTEFFDPFDCWTGKMDITPNTYSIHHAEATWNPNENKNVRRLRYWKYRIERTVDGIRHIPNHIMKALLSEEEYHLIKEKMKRR